jgi:uncharacterized membrane protein YkoI
MHKGKFKSLAVLSLMAMPAFAAQPPKNIISMDHAKEIAIKASPGSVKSSEIEFEMKQWVYSFDIQGTDNQIHEVLVNAKTGRVVENKVESAAQEAKEAKERRKFFSS